jgi:long-chain fatty acid transport protein
MYRLNERWTVGAAFTSQTPLEFHGGRLDSNQAALGLGRVRYRNVRIRGLGLPNELGLGVAWRPTRHWLASAEVSWLGWSGVMNRSTLTATAPDNPAAPSVLRSVAVNDWHDQIVLAAGVAWEPDRRWTLRAGFNHGRNPIPSRNMNPLLAVFSEDHLTLGLGYRRDAHWRFDAALEYALQGAVTYDNPALPFGPGASEKGETLTLHLMASRTW